MMMPKPMPKPLPLPKPGLPPSCFPHPLPMPILPPVVRPMPPALQDRMEFQRLDRDGDGVLSRNEFPDSRTHVNRFAKYDADQDGNIDAKEYAIGQHWERMTQWAQGFWRDGFLPLSRGGQEAEGRSKLSLPSFGRPSVEQG